MALLVAAMPQNRDTTAAITRATGVSNRESRAKQNVAKVVTQVPGALDALKDGKVSAEHLAALVPVADTPSAAVLLAEVGSKSPEELGREAQQMKLSMECANDVVKRQHQQRYVRFFDGPDGMIGINGLFPPLEGAQLKTKLAAVVNARYKAAHPERAKTLGGHGEDTTINELPTRYWRCAGSGPVGSHRSLNRPRQQRLVPMIGLAGEATNRLQLDPPRVVELALANPFCG